MGTFSPINGSSLAVSATSVTSSTALATTGHLRTVMLQTEASDSPVYVRLGEGAQTGTTTDCCILPGVPYFIDVPSDATHIGAICDASNTATLHVTNVYVTTGRT